LHSVIVGVLGNTLPNNSIKYIEITDLLGGLKLSVILSDSEGTKSINFEALPSGIYFIKATDTNGNVMNGKFVKE
jgi:hypothetical protein